MGDLHSLLQGEKGSGHEGRGRARKSEIRAGKRDVRGMQRVKLLNGDGMKGTTKRAEMRKELGLEKPGVVMVMVFALALPMLRLARAMLSQTS